MKPATRAIAHASVHSTAVHYRHDIATGRHALVADEPAAAGGQDAGPAPYDYVLAGLGACTAITLRMYAEKKGWELGELQVELALSKDREGNTYIARELSSTAALGEEQWSRLLEIAARTPVTLTLQQGAAITTTRKP
ncbi:OsmC family protein [Frateuria defendens]|uniref:OsmC family protein n=1 Tax=Frateuria defendens TaxID=2219559 RepID=UPI0009E29CA5|nr:OsmC family protein [Frateuria defendens]